MKRRDFLKITMGAFGSAMGIAVAKADVLQGVSQEMPKPAEPISFGPCDVKAEGIKPIWSDKLLKEIAEAGRMLDEKKIPNDPRDRWALDANTGEVVHFENLIDPVTFERVRMKRTKNGWVKA